MTNPVEIYNRRTCNTRLRLHNLHILLTKLDNYMLTLTKLRDETRLNLVRNPCIRQHNYTKLIAVNKILKELEPYKTDLQVLLLNAYLEDILTINENYFAKHSWIVRYDAVVRSFKHYMFFLKQYDFI